MLFKTDRIFYFDELRALAILFVILCHAGQFFPTTLYYLSSPTVLSYISIGRMGVPLFFIISGALLINKDYTLGEFFKKRFSRILIPAAFWYLISFIVFFAFTGYNYDLIITWFHHNDLSWFIYAMIGIYLIIPLFNSFVKEFGTLGAEYFLIIWIILIILFNLNYEVPYLFDNFGIYGGYAMLGYYLANKKFKVYSNAMIMFNLIIFIACLLINLHIAFTYTVVIRYFSIVLVIECSSLFLIFRYISKYAELKPSRMLSKIHNFIKNSFIGTLIYVLSICSYALFFIHLILVKVIASNFTISKFDMIPVMFIIITGLSLAVAVLLSVVPGLNKIAGVY